MYFKLVVVIDKGRLFVEFTWKGKKQKPENLWIPEIIYIYMLFTSHTKMTKNKNNNKKKTKKKQQQHHDF